MAILQILSDEHLEFLSEPDQTRFLEKLDPEGVDVLILAGDICLARQMRRILPVLCAKFKDVVYVPGNHEHYGSSFSEVRFILDDLEKAYPNLMIFNDRQVKTVAGLNMIGVTLWFPRPAPQVESLGLMTLNDFRAIRKFHPEVYTQHDLDLAALREFAPVADVVITHHIPSTLGVSPRFTGNGNHFFCHDLTNEIGEWQPKLWVFGHTHDRKMFRIGDTTLVANPGGYPSEGESQARGAYVKRCLIRVDDKGVEFLSGIPG